MGTGRQGWGRFAAVLALGALGPLASPAPVRAGSCSCGTLTVPKSEIDCNQCCAVSFGLGQMIVAYTLCRDNKLPPSYASYLQKYHIGGVEPRYCNNSPDLKAIVPPLITASNGYGKHGDEPEVQWEKKKVTIDQSAIKTNPFDITSRKDEQFLLDDSCHRLLGFASCQFSRQAGFNTLFGPSVEVGPDWPEELTSTWLKYDVANIKGHRDAGCMNTIKHYPFVTESGEMHRSMGVSDKPLSEVVKAEAGFDSAIRNEQPTFVMTTHLLDKNVDPAAPATFSPAWIKRLRNLGGGGAKTPLVMTDGMFMVNNYAVKDYYPYILGGVDATAEGILTEADMGEIAKCPTDMPASRSTLMQLAFDPGAKAGKTERPIFPAFAKLKGKAKLSAGDYMMAAIAMGMNDGSIPIEDSERKLIDQFHCIADKFAADQALRKRLKTTDEKFMGLVSERAIMAGHDMVIVEGSPADGARSMDFMIASACSASPAGEAFRGRIIESSARVAKLKASPAFKKSLEPATPADLPKEVAHAVVNLIEDMNKFLGSDQGKKLVQLARTNADCRRQIQASFNCMTRYPNVMKTVDAEPPSGG